MKLQLLGLMDAAFKISLQLSKIIKLFASFTSNNRDEIHNIVEKMNPETDRGVFSTTDCQQVLYFY